MATDRDRASNASSIAAIIAIAAVFLLFVVIVFRGCQDAGPGADTINPDNPLPGAEDATGWAPPVEAAPLLT